MAKHDFTPFDSPKEEQRGVQFSISTYINHQRIFQGAFLCHPNRKFDMAMVWKKC
jgi:hypothetical protein